MNRGCSRRSPPMAVKQNPFTTAGRSRLTVSSEVTREHKANSFLRLCTHKCPFQSGRRVQTTQTIKNGPGRGFAWFHNPRKSLLRTDQGWRRQNLTFYLAGKTVACVSSIAGSSRDVLRRTGVPRSSKGRGGAEHRRRMARIWPHRASVPTARNKCLITVEDELGEEVFRSAAAR